MSKIENSTYQVTGMSCARCAAHVEEALKETSGVRHAKVDLKEKNVSLTYDADEASSEKLKAAVKSAGYTRHVE